MPTIAVVTPLFPLPDEPYRGQPIYQTVRAFQRYADVRVFCPIAKYPYLRAVACLPALRPELLATGSTRDLLLLPSLAVSQPAMERRFCARSLAPYLKKLRPDLVLNFWVYPEGYAE